MVLIFKYNDLEIGLVVYLVGLHVFYETQLKSFKDKSLF